ncbi:hypothetical protein SAMN05216205_4899 [Pseudomonas mohnii]|uniref:Uncharacterized protein n=1 Tax=Pseudomonas mohnii TaxID=395600 RepID=A0ABY0YC84_9PSED|nr:hypothetical protein [Pseudomonas mohnii]SED31961.1 hypothetical protein SAMN05216205_4899 [Pseudomonas mohnii]
MSIRATASTLIVTALALVGDYSAIQPVGHAHASHEATHRHPKVRDLRQTIAELTKGWQELDSIYTEALRLAYDSNTFDDKRFLRNMELLSATRTLESSLKAAVVPTELSSDHLTLRRAIAKTRTRLAMLDSFYRQFFVVPEEFESAASPAGLRALADHTTRRLSELA